MVICLMRRAGKKAVTYWNTPCKRHMFVRYHNAMSIKTNAAIAASRVTGKLSGAMTHAAGAYYRIRAHSIPDERVRCYCPCCNTKLLKWKVCGYSRVPSLFDVTRYATASQDVICPACGSVPRHRVIAWRFGQHPELVEGKSVLHFAPERGITLWLKRHGVSVTTADLHARADLKVDIQDTGLARDSYDVILCNHVLEHVADYRRALSELHRILRPNGLLICSFPVDPRFETVYEDSRYVTAEDRIAHFGQHDHLRVFGADSKRMLEDAGFEVQVVRGSDCPARIRPVTGPADYDSADVFFCRKLTRR